MARKAKPTAAKKTSGAGRHSPTDESREQVYDLIADSNSQAKVARVLGISVATLKRHYAAELAKGRGVTGGYVPTYYPDEHWPEAETIDYVIRGVVLGTPHKIIARALGISLNTLKAKYPEQLAYGRTMLNNEAAGHLVQKMRRGDTQSIIFYLKAQAGWKERAGLDLSNEDGSLQPTTINIVAASQGAR